MFGFGEFGGPDCRRCGGYYPGNPGAYSGYWCRCSTKKQEKKNEKKDEKQKGGE